MAGKTIDKDGLRAAIEAYCKESGKQFSEGDTGKFTIFQDTPNPGDPMLWVENGLFRCNDTEFGLSFVERLEPPKTIDFMPAKNVPAPARNGNDHQMVQSPAIRDIQVAEMTFEDIKNFICPAASDKDAYMFLKLCQARNLNPFTNEAFLIPYKTKEGEIKCSMVVGKEAFMRKSEANKFYRGFKAGIIVSKGDDLIYREGTFLRKGEDLEGGWAEVYREDRKEPIRSEVSLAEYDSQKSLWVGKKATMIRKVAVVQSHREAFPSDLAGCYTNDELGINQEREVVV